MLVGHTLFADSEDTGSSTKVFESIIHSPVRYPWFLHSAVQDVLQCLLNRRPEDRLGAGREGGLNIMSHEWFVDIDWKRLAHREVPAVYIPAVKSGVGDTSMYDDYAECDDELDIPGSDTM